MEAKQKAIKDHYIKAFIDSGMSEKKANEAFNSIESEIDDNGWNPNWNSPYNKSSILMQHLPYGTGTAWRPLTLKGIETNRGWNKIEDGLPEELIEKRVVVWMARDGHIFKGYFYNSYGGLNYSVASIEECDEYIQGRNMDSAKDLDGWHP